MGAQHTPGPWFIEGNFIKAPDGDDDDDAWCVAEAMPDCGHPEDQSEANARLIAAAPCMLAALRFVYPRLDALPDALRFEAERIVSAAITKATGEAAP